MNLDKKLELAQEWAMKMVGEVRSDPMNSASKKLSVMAWKYADAMEAEYNKRKQEEIESGIEQDKEMLDSFQVDWSQAPSWANWWAMDRDNDAYWHSCVDKPFIQGAVFEIATPQGHTSDAPSFNYQGDWKDSLRKRP